MLAEVPDHQTASSPAAGLPRLGPRIRQYEIDDVLVLAPQGGLDAPLIEAMDAAVRCATAPVVIDLNDCIVVDPNVLHPASGADRPLPQEQELCVACRRLSARRLLSRTSVLDGVAVFRSVQDAVQSRLLHRAGYGEGWVRA